MRCAVVRSTLCSVRLQTAPIGRRCARAVVARSRAGQPFEAASEKLPFALFGDTASPGKRKFDEAAAVENVEAVKAKRRRWWGGEDGVVMIEGLGSDVPIGAQLRIGDQQTGVLVWRHTELISFALILDGDQSVVSDGVEARSDVTAEDGVFMVSTGWHLRGTVVTEVLTSAAQERGWTPLFNKELDMASRQCIYQPLFMQHKGIDILTPIGRGQCILLVSENRKELTNVVEHMNAAHGYNKTSVFTVYASIGKSLEETNALKLRLRQKGILENCAVVTASAERSLAERYAAMCAALSIGERVRDEGGDALVILDSLAPLSQLWNFMQKAATEHNRRMGIDTSAKESELVEVDGTFMAFRTAERRRFFSSVLQRASKASEALGGGSMTLVPVVQGSLATGTKAKEVQTRLEAIEKDPRLSEELKEKLRAKLKAVTSPDSSAEAESIATFIVEEFLSIADGQIVIKDTTEGGTSIDPLSSVSRIGARAFPPILEPLASNIRLQLAQATDAMPFQSGQGSKDDKWVYESEVLTEFLKQRSDELTPLWHQVISLLALQSTKGTTLTKQTLLERLSHLLTHFERNHPDLIQSIESGENGDVINSINAILMDIM